MIYVINGAVRFVASQESVAKFTPDVIETLLSKHPSSSNDLRSGSVFSFCLHIPATSSDVGIAMKSLICYSSTGIDGLRPGNIRDLISDGTAEAEIRLLDSISALINLFLSGHLSDYPSQLIFDNNLTA